MGNIDKSIEEIRSELRATPKYLFVETNRRKTDEEIDQFYPEIMSVDVKLGWYVPNFRRIFRETYADHKKEIQEFISGAIKKSKTPVMHNSFKYLLFDQYLQEHPETISQNAFIEILNSEVSLAFAETICSALKWNPQTPAELIRIIMAENKGNGVSDEDALNGIITDSLFSYITAPQAHMEDGSNQSLGAKMYLPDGKLKDPWIDYRLRKR